MYSGTKYKYIAIDIYCQELLVDCHENSTSKFMVRHVSLRMKKIFCGKNNRIITINLLIMGVCYGILWMGQCERSKSVRLKMIL
jgi:hypothetical protein